MSLMVWRVGLAGAVMVSLALAARPAEAQTISCPMPYTFTNSTIADANQVNANFAATTACLQAAYTSAVATRGSTPNLLCNPFMEIDQANEGAALNLGGGIIRPVDCWAVTTGTSAAVGTAQRVADGPIGYPRSLKLTTTTGSAVGATDSMLVLQYIEANNIAETAFGTSAAQSLTLSFWVKSSIAPYTMSGSLENGAFTRSYPFNVAISTANTWEYHSITIPGDTAGTWVLSGAGIGMVLNLTAATGATGQGTANAWAIGDKIATSSITNTLLSTNGATFNVGPVKLEIAAAASGFGRRNFQAEFAFAQRYFEKSYSLGTAYGTPATPVGVIELSASGTTSNSSIRYATPKACDAFVTLFSDITGSPAVIRDNTAGADVGVTISGKGQNGFSYVPTAGTVDQHLYSGHFVADCRL